MYDLNDLYYFVQVVDHGGFAPAGRGLGLPKSKLSRRVAGLEKRLGLRLINRSTRRFSVTDAGQDYYRHCVAMLVEADAAEQAIECATSEPRGRVVFGCPTALLHFQVAPMLARYMLQYPRVVLQVEATDRRVDVIREGFDIVLRVRFPPIEDSDLAMRALTRSPQQLMASPGLVEGLTAPLAPGDLSALPSLDWHRHDGKHAWCLEGPDGATAEIYHRPRLVSDDLMLLRCAALQGAGIVQLPLLVAGDDLREGRLVEVIPQWRPRGGVVHAVFASRRGLLPSVRALLDHLAESFGQVV